MTVVVWFNPERLRVDLDDDSTVQPRVAAAVGLLSLSPPPPTTTVARINPEQWRQSMFFFLEMAPSVGQTKPTKDTYPSWKIHIFHRLTFVVKR
jgi:hypothetical protein